MSPKLLAAALSATMLLAAPAAHASDTKDARAAIAAVKAKLDMNERAGLTGAAADAQARARLRLERAQKLLKDGRESGAAAVAKEADSLADLAAATGQRQEAQGQARDAEAALAPVRR